MQLPPHLHVLLGQLDSLSDSAFKRIDILCELAWELRRLDSTKSLEIAREALELAKTQDYKPGKALALLAIGFAQMRFAHYEEAQNKASQSYQLFQELGDSNGIYKALNLLGTLQGQMGELSKALATFLETQKLCESLNDIQGAAAALNNAALTYSYLGDYAHALELYLQALHYYEALSDNAGMARTLANLGSAYYELEHFEKALESFESALKHQGEWRDANVHSHILMSLGKTLERLSKFEEALSYTLESLNICIESSNRLGMAHAFDTLGSIFLSQGQIQEAEKNFSKALDIERNLGDRLEEIKTSLKLAELWRDTKRYDEALKLVKQALSIAETAGTKAESYKAHQLLSQLFEYTGDLANALRHHKSYAELKDEVFNAHSDLKLQSLTVTHQVEQTKREREIYRLKNVELAEANQQLLALNESLKQLDQQKTSLLVQLERQASEDSLTKLYNRRFFEQKMHLLFPEAKMHGQDLSMMICDIDNFKQINDTFSHQMGDEVLKQVAQLLKGNVRKPDILARYGGEEFVLCMPYTSLSEAVRVCERLRTSIESYDWKSLHPKLNVTLSLGLASDLSVENHERLLSLADFQLYEAKHNGKNRLCYPHQELSCTNSGSNVK